MSSNSSRPSHSTNHHPFLRAHVRPPVLHFLSHRPQVRPPREVTSPELPILTRPSPALLYTELSFPSLGSLYVLSLFHCQGALWDCCVFFHEMALVITSSPLPKPTAHWLGRRPRRRLPRPNMASPLAQVTTGSPVRRRRSALSSLLLCCSSPPPLPHPHSVLLGGWEYAELCAVPACRRHCPHIRPPEITKVSRGSRG